MKITLKKVKKLLNRNLNDIRRELSSTIDEQEMSIPSMPSIDDDCDVEGDLQNYHSKKY